MSDTKIEKIRAFNKKHAEPENVPTPTNDNPPTPAPDDGTKTARQKIKEKAEEKPKTPEQIAEEQRLEQERIEQERIDALHQVTDATATMIDAINQRVEPAKNWISGLKTPGGLMAVILAIIGFALIAIPVNPQGDTRAFLLWQTLLGRTHMQYEDNIQPGGNKVSGTTTITVPSIAGTAGSAVPYGSSGPDVSYLNSLNLFGFE